MAHISNSGCEENMKWNSGGDGYEAGQTMWHFLYPQTTLNNGRVVLVLERKHMRVHGAHEGPGYSTGILRQELRATQARGCEDSHSL